jgi:hypothetical protein
MNIFLTMTHSKWDLFGVYMHFQLFFNVRRGRPPTKMLDL